MSFDQCVLVTDAGLLAFGMHCASLKHISMIQCDISDVGLMSLAISCKKLREIVTSRCSKVTRAGKALVKTALQFQPNNSYERLFYDT